MSRKRVNRRRLILLLAAGVLTLLPIALWAASPNAPFRQAPEEPSAVAQHAAAEAAIPDLILMGAKEEAKKKTRYDASYQSISYPGGDVAPERGACTDVVIRALRAAGYDLQRLIHEDMSENFNLYPPLWGLSKPDSNIDHRRTQNQMVYFERFGEKLTLEVTEAELSQWQSGDIVYWTFPNGQEHTGIISDRTNRAGIPLVIHNSSIAREEDCLLRWEIIGHYRFPGQNLSPD
ncbi:MAG: DUF1287 domain-containing protein [Firmicutes bacterium]|nr:DUF1287 domain-containing protein [Bacillota bacterium]